MWRSSTVRDSLPDQFRGLPFSTMQINVGLRPKPHRDAASVGASLTVSLGPFTGGLLWQASTQQPTVFVNDVAFLPPWTWNAMDGVCLHGSTPHHGQRCSLVLFTHEVSFAAAAFARRGKGDGTWIGHHLARHAPGFRGQGGAGLGVPR